MFLSNFIFASDVENLPTVAREKEQEGCQSPRFSKTPRCLWMHILRVSYYAKLPFVFLRKAASHCRVQTGPLPLFKRQPVQTVNHGSEGDFWGGRQFAHSHWILRSPIVLHCTSSSPAKSKTLPCQFIATIPAAVVSRPRRISQLGWRTNESSSLRPPVLSFQQ